jgi:integrating conjugative element protein (TIGR03758 family)
MTAAQATVFEAGSGVGPTALLTAIAAMVLLLTMVWVVWVTLGTFRAWQEGQATVFDLAWSSLRASMILMVLGFYLR